MVFTCPIHTHVCSHLVTNMAAHCNAQNVMENSIKDFGMQHSRTSPMLKIFGVCDRLRVPSLARRRSIETQAWLRKLAQVTSADMLIRQRFALRGGTGMTLRVQGTGRAHDDAPRSATPGHQHGWPRPYVLHSKCAANADFKAGRSRRSLECVRMFQSDPTHVAYVITRLEH